MEKLKYYLFTWLILALVSGCMTQRMKIGVEMVQEAEALCDVNGGLKEDVYYLAQDSNEAQYPYAAVVLCNNRAKFNHRFKGD